jgi:hypothetical protein
VRRPRRARWIGLAAVASAGLLSGCYYYPYGYSPWVYPPYPYTPGYPNGVADSYPPAPGAAAPPYPQQPAPGVAPQYPQQPAVGAPQPLTEPVERTPLPEPVP